MLALFTVGCGEKSTAPKEPPPPPAVGSITIEPLSLTLETSLSRVVQATVRDVNGVLLTERTLQWSSSAPAVANVPANANSILATINAISPGTATITATSGGRSGSVVVTVVPAPPMDFSIDDAQWTQAAQDALGSMPMVLGGRGAVLVVRMSSTTANRSPGMLRLRVTDASGATVFADSSTPAPFVGAATYAAPSAQFLLRSSLLRPGLSWRVERDPTHAVTDTNSANDVFPRAAPGLLATGTAAPLHIRFVPVALNAHSGAPATISAANIERYLATLKRMFPLGQLTTTIADPVSTSANFGTAPNGGPDSFWIQVLTDLDLARLADTSSRNTYWMGVIQPPPGFSNTGYGGFSYVPTNFLSTARGTHTSAVVAAEWFFNQTLTADLVVHELSHAHGRRHAPCGNAAGTDPNYPVTGGLIGAPGHNVFTWSAGDATSTFVFAASTGDVMGYCYPQWISAYTYGGLLNARLAINQFAAVADIPAPRQLITVVRGVIHRDRIDILPTVRMSGVATSDVRGDYTIDLLAHDGDVLATQRVEANALDHSEAQTFLAAFPIAESEAQRVSQIRVTGPKGVTTRTRAARASTDSRNRIVISVSGANRSLVECLGAETAAVLVQDHDTGELLASAHSSRATLAARMGQRVDVSCSDGVRTVRETQVIR